MTTKLQEENVTKEEITEAQLKAEAAVDAELQKEEVMSTQEEKMLKIERESIEYFIKKDMHKEQSDRNKEKIEKIKDLFDSLDIPRMVFETRNNEWITLERKTTQKEVLDIEAFLVYANAGIGENEHVLEKEDLKSPWDYAKLTEKGRITAEMISKHTYLDTQTKVKVSKTKRKPKEAKEKEADDIIKASK